MAMLKDDILARIRDAMKQGRALEKEILKVALGEIQTLEHRTGKDASDEECAAVIRKLIKSNEETLSLTEGATERDKLSEENSILRTFLPQSLDADAIVQALAPVVDAIRAAKADGQAMGAAMKQLKSVGAVVDAKDVTEAVRRLRA